ncbi:MAG: ATP-dependent helicase [Lachnospiraceae bacterium]|jgi:DNA helicase-2/ATP-dependent DNA helicase PcrA|nr:ATP-dependent helicase [Lachnospiraceae bacterium]
MKQSLNLSQSEAISHREGPALILAGPGSGKTLVITQRVKNLIEEQNVNPSHILVITFTKAAARQMKERFVKMMGEVHCAVTFGTFHAIFFSILKYAYHYTAQNIIREEQKYQFLREIMSRMELEYEDEQDFISGVLGEISLVKNEGIKLEHYYARNCGADIFRKIYREYEKRMQRAGLLDFDDMLVYTYELFRERKDILALWQKQYSYILIDEFQDINYLQFEIVKMMALPKNNLFVVGDDDQSIYRFRGAKPELMLNFKKSYPMAREILLDINYRSSSRITQAAQRLIAHNSDRFLKAIKSQEKQEGIVQFSLYENQWDESEAVLLDIKRQIEKGIPYQEIAVLFRTNVQQRMMMRQLLNHNIPFVARDTIPNLYEHWVAKDMFTYIRIALGSRERKDLLKIMNRPKRYIGRESLEESSVAFDVWMEYYREQSWIAERIDRLEYDIKMLSGMKPFAAMNYIRNGIGYDEFCKEYSEYRHINVEELLEILDELQESAKEYDSYEAWFLHMEEYKRELERQAREQQYRPEGITLATLHSAKGLEYEVVYLVDVNEGIMPYKKAVLDQDMEEERRMFYVGMTRAKRELYLSSVKEYHGKKAEISRFIKEAL